MCVNVHAGALTVNPPSVRCVSPRQLLATAYSERLVMAPQLVSDRELSRGQPPTMAIMPASVKSCAGQQRGGKASHLV